MAPDSRPKHDLYCRLRSRIAPLLARSRPARSQCIVSAVSNTTVALNSSDARDGEFEASSDSATPQPPIIGHDRIATQGATAQNHLPLQETQETAVHASAAAVVSSPSTSSNSAPTPSASSSPSAGRETSHEPVDPLSLLPSGRRESLRAIVSATAAPHSDPNVHLIHDSSPSSSASAERDDPHSTEVGRPYERSPPEPGVSSSDLPPGLPHASDAAFAAGAQSLVSPLVAAIDRLGDRIENASTTVTRGLQEINGSVVRIAGRLDERRSTGVTTPQLEESPTASISYTTLDASAAQETAIIHTTDGPPNPGAWSSPVPLSMTPSPLGAGMDVAALQAQLSGFGGVPPNLLLAGGEVRLPAAGAEGRSAAPATRAAEEQATDEPRTHRLRAHIMLPPDDEGQASGCAVQPEPRIGLQDNRWNVIDDGPTTDANADNAADSVPLPAIPEVTNIAATPSNREVEVPTVRDLADLPPDSRAHAAAAQETRLEDAGEPNESAVGTGVGPEDENSASAADPASPSSPAEDASIDNPESTAQAAHVQATTEDDPIWTLIGCRTTQELCPGTLQLVVDVDTDGEVGDCQVLVRADFDKAMECLPMICEARKIQLTQLYLRIGRAQDRHGEDMMLRVMRCLKPYLCFFSLVHLNMVEEPADIEETDQKAFKDDFSCLLSLTIEGQATLRHFLLFPLASLRQLDIRAKIGLVEILNIVDFAKNLDILALDFDSTVQSGSCSDAADPALQAGNVRFPPAVSIRTDDPSGLVPSLKAAASMIRYLRLTAKENMVLGSEVKALLSAHNNWHMNISR
ncbi:hypothetical protein EV121DRAFT_274072 [Schizophyllum commune]